MCRVVSLYQSLPGQTNLAKGLSLGLTMWFFSSGDVSSFKLGDIPGSSTDPFYTLITGLVEMLIIGLFYGLALRP